MRILVLIIMVITFLIGGGASFFIGKNLDSRLGNYDGYEEMEKKVNELKEAGVNLEDIQDPETKKVVEKFNSIPSKGRTSTTSILGKIAALLALGMIVFAFMKKEMVTKVGFAVVALYLLLWILAPSIKATAYSGANPKNLALVSFICIAISGACAHFSYKMYLKKA